MKIVIAASEAVPFAKTGGLADVIGALPVALAALGHDVRVMMPRYRSIDAERYGLVPVGRPFDVPISDRREPAQLFEGRLGNKVPIYFIEQKKYFDRQELYQTAAGDYPDNAERFVYFSRAVLEACRNLKLRPEIIHCNDWQTGLIPVYLKTLYARDAEFEGTASLFTIHNLAYQGLFWHLDLHLTGLGWEIFTPEGIEFYGKLNFLKGGLVYADVLNTVSATYAQEIQSPAYGCGLEGVLQRRRADLFGIVNGIDIETWNPAADPALPAPYDAADRKGKAICKKFLQRELGLPVRSTIPLIGMVSRLADQKGIDFLAEALDSLTSLDLQFALLGSGKPEFEELFSKTSARKRKRMAVVVGFDDALARRLYAGSDFFLIPSRYEPCGLAQMIAYRYGTVPIVRRTGGLADTVVDVDAPGDGGTGIVFDAADPAALLKAVRRGLSVYHDTRAWRSLVSRGMAQDYSWTSSAKRYVELYGRALEKRRPNVRGPKN